MGNGYTTEEHGHIIVVQEGDDTTQIEEIEPNGFFVDDIPTFEFVEAFVDGDNLVYEIVVALDNERTIAIIANARCLNTNLAALLQKHSN